MGGHRSGKQLFLSWIYPSLTSARTQPVNITVGTLTWKLVSSLFISYWINIDGEAVCRVLCLLQTCSSICLANLSVEMECQDHKLSVSNWNSSGPKPVPSVCVSYLGPWRHQPPKCSSAPLSSPSALATSIAAPHILSRWPNMVILLPCFYLIVPATSCLLCLITH